MSPFHPTVVRGLKSRYQCQFQSQRERRVWEERGGKGHALLEVDSHEDLEVVLVGVGVSLEKLCVLDGGIDIVNRARAVVPADLPFSSDGEGKSGRLEGGQDAPDNDEKPVVVAVDDVVGSDASLLRDGKHRVVSAAGLSLQGGRRQLTRTVWAPRRSRGSSSARI